LGARNLESVSGENGFALIFMQSWPWLDAISDPQVTCSAINRVIACVSLSLKPILKKGVHHEDPQKNHHRETRPRSLGPPCRARSAEPRVLGWHGSCQDRHLQASWQSLRSGRLRILYWECDGRGTHDRASLGSRA